DCHHPHTMKPLAAGNALCIRCHLPQKYDTIDHHHHQVGSTGAQCVECHMPHKNFMVVDARRDHSLRIPRPDLTKKTGAPNACNQCHQDQTADWSVNAFHEWWGNGPRNAHYGEILASARSGVPGGTQKLIDLANDLERPAIVRATALNDLAEQPVDRQDIQAATARLQDPDPLVRMTAAGLMQQLPAAERIPLVAPLLTDPIAAVRAEAARVLAGAASQLDENQKADFLRAADEFEKKQRAIADRAAGYLRLALFYNDLGRLTDAETAYRKATTIEPNAVPVWVNLGELLFQQGSYDEAETAFRSAVEKALLEENRGVAHDALARFLIRLKRYDEGVAELKEAARLLPENAQIQYFLGVALNSTGHFDDALGYLKKAHELDPNNAEYLAGLATICRDAGRWDEALTAAEKLGALHPDDRQAMALIDQIRALRAQQPQ
ncbi:MAG: tetratricopeptide repeat protein, partial [Verrucomicrobiae bacterium]|nr:tetratricopeptide repeat protein [Verrucomicrobiae bacterium]